MTRLLFTAAIVALLSACSNMGGMTTGSSGMSRTNEMGAAGYIGSGNSTGAYGNGSSSIYGNGPN